MQRIIRFVKLVLHRELPLADHQLIQLAEEIIGYGCMGSLFLLPDPATQQRTIGVDVDDLAFRLRETNGNVTAALVLLGEEGRASRTWLDGHWILRLRPEDMRNVAPKGHNEKRSA